MNDKLKNFFTGDSQESLRFRYQGAVRYMPLIICGGFFLLTILTFAFGPLDWHVDNSFKLYSFLFLCCAALIIGYVIAVKKGKSSDIKLDFNTNHIFIICAIVYLAFYIPTLMTTTGKWYPDIITGITNTGIAYRTSQYYVQNTSQAMMYVQILFTPFLILILPLTFFFMPKLKKYNKILGVLIIILSICLSISQGVNKAVADLTAQLLIFLFMMFFTNSYNGSKIKHFFIILGLIILTCILFFTYYTTAMRNRVAFDNMGYSQQEIDSLLKDGKSIPISDVPEEKLDKSITTYSNLNMATEKENYFLTSLLPEKVKPTALYLLSYLTHGYKGLSIAMDQEFTSSYGLGFSDFFRRNFFRAFGGPDAEQELFNRTYISKTSREGWETGAIWSSFFVYPASDISFFGTILLVLLIGYLFGLSWKDALKTDNPFALAAFFGFCTMVFYFCANNQMFQNGENSIGFIVTIIIWFLTRSYLRKHNKKLLAGENN